MWELGRIKVDCNISYQSVLDYECLSEKNKYSNAYITLRLSGSTDKSIVDRSKGTKVTVSLSDGTCLLKGICKDAVLKSAARYAELTLHISSAAYEMDQEKKSRSFQNPGKTLKTIADKIVSDVGGRVNVKSNQTIKEIISQNEETNWAFLTKLAGSFGLAVYENNKSSSVDLHIGSEGIFIKKWGEDFQIKSRSRNLVDTIKAEAKGIQAMPYDFEELTVITYDPVISAGYKIGDYIVQKSKIKTEKEILVNELVLSRKAGKEVQKATAATAKGASNYCNFYKGTVLEVDGTNVKVHFSIDENQEKSEAVWMPYENNISNYFYCMPDVGDTVFVYYESTGLAICMGSMHTNTDHPDFANPKDKILTTQDNMIKFSEKFLELLAGREEKDNGGEEYSSIELNLEDGIKVHGKGTVNFVTTGNGNIELRSDGRDGYLDFTALDQIYLLVGMNRILIDDDQVYIKGSQFYWEGFHKGSGYEFKEEIYKEKSLFDVFLSAAQLVVDVASIFTPPLISSALSLVSAGISLAKGDVAGCVMGLVGAIPLAGNIAKAGKVGKTLSKAGKVGKTLSKAGKFAKSAKNTITGIKYAKQIGFGIKMVVYFASAKSAVMGLMDKVPQIADRIKKGEFNPFTDLDDMDLLLSTVNDAVNLGGAIKDVKDGIGDYRKPKTDSPDADLPDKPKDADLPAKPKDTDLPDKELEKSMEAAAATKAPDNMPEGSGTKSKTTDTPETGKSTKQSTHDGDPVDMVTGSLYLRHTDMLIKDVMGDFRLTRTYESVYTNENHMLGSKWVLNIETKLHRKADYITVRMPDNHLEHFVKTESGWKNERANDMSFTLKESAQGFELYIRKNKRRYYFDLHGYLKSICDNNNNSMTFLYQGSFVSSILFTSGQRLDFQYADNKLISVKDVIGRETKYEYDGDYLTSVLYPNNGRLTYEYTAQGYVYKIYDQNGINYITNQYDRKGRITRQVMADGEEYIYLYDDVNRVNTILTVKTGKNVRYEYNNKQLVTKTWYPDETFKEVLFDEWDNPIYERDRNGNETHRVYNAGGLLLEERRAEGLCTKYSYDEEDNLIWKSDNTGRELKFTYDECGNIILREEKIDNKSWNTTRYTYDEKGRLISVTDANGNTATLGYETMYPYASVYKGPEGETFWYTYDQAGRNMSIKGELGTIHFGYNAMDLKTHVKDALGNVTRYFYDRTNNLIKLVLPNGYNKVTDGGEGIIYSYDTMDHVVAIRDMIGNVTAFHKDSEGRILKEINPNTYDPSTNDGDGIAYTYDGEGRRTHIKYPNGGIERIFYDPEGNIIKKVQPMEYDKAKDDGLGYTYLYDKENRLIQITNPEGVVEKRYVYDLAGRIVKVINAEGYLTGDNDKSRIGTLYTYNFMGWLLEVREPVMVKGNQPKAEAFYQLTTYEYDLAGNVIEERRYLDYQTVDSARGKVNIIRKEYDKSNRLIKVTDQLGAVMEYRYNSHNQLTYEMRRINHKCENKTAYLYDKVGRVSTIIHSADENYLGKKSVRTTYEYDKNGNLIKIMTPGGNKILRQYDMANRIIKEIHQEVGGTVKNETTFDYDKSGNLICVTDSHGATIRYAYDLLDRNIAITGKNGGTQIIEYDLNGRVTRKVLPTEFAKENENAAGYRYTYDLMGRIKKILAPDGTVESIREYDNAGRMISLMDGMGSGVNISYDFGGRRTCVTTLGGTTQSWQYDAAGNLVGVMDGNGNKTEYVLDSWGRIVKIKKADGSEESYAYDYAGNIISSTDGEGNTTTFTYNSINKLAGRTDPCGQTEKYLYDEEGRIGKYIDRNGNTTIYRYNFYGSLTLRKNETTEVEEVFGYDSEGLLKYAIAGGMRYDYTYYPDGSLKEKKASGRTLLSYAYDLNGNKTEQTDISGKKTVYTYNLKNQLIGVTDNGKKLAQYSYYPDGRLRDIRVHKERDISGATNDLTIDKSNNWLENSTEKENSYVNGIEKLVEPKDRYVSEPSKNLIELLTSYAYDIDKNLIELKTGYAYHGDSNSMGLPTSTSGAELNLLVNNHYSYDGNGNCLVKETLTGKHIYDYDSQNRLVKAAYPTYTESFYYDRAGNRSRYVASPIHSEGSQGYLTDNIEVNYLYGAGNRLIEMTTKQNQTEEVTQFEYDKNGNLLKDGRARYNYDSFNRLERVETFDGHIQVNRYDGEGLRHEIEENGELVQFIYSGSEVIAETDKENRLTRYIRGYELISADSDKARTYYHYCNDELGSITHILDEEGNILNRYEYDAFGNTVMCEESVSNRFRFTGQQYDSITVQYYLRARYYNPVIGRFIQEDTYYGDGLNLYAYCENNPVRYVDPSGYTKVDAFEKPGGDQQALQDLAKDVNDKGGASIEEKEILYQWANEYGVDRDKLGLKDQLLLPYNPDVSNSTLNQGVGNTKGSLNTDSINQPRFPEDPNKLFPENYPGMSKEVKPDGKIIYEVEAGGKKYKVEYHPKHGGSDHYDGNHYHVKKQGEYAPGNKTVPPYFRIPNLDPNTPTKFGGGTFAPGDLLPTKNKK